MIELSDNQATTTSVRAYTPKPFTDVFTPADTDLDRRGARRVVPMKVLALGLGRTGTTSLRTALIDLGFDDCYHMMSASVENPPDCLMWSDALAAKYDGVGKFGPEDWDRLLGHCQAVCDWPAVAFAKELIEAYPSAKVILTTRGLESWHASTMKTVHWRATEPVLKALSKVDWAASMYQPMLSKFWYEFWEGDFENNGKRRFTEYYEHVQSLVPPEKLLIYNVSEGWGPLCKFLEVPIPVGKEFPFVNDTRGFVDRCRTRNFMQALNVCVRAFFFGSLAVVAILTLSVGMQTLAIR